jgi:glycosyltransferase involved in cell wall biosynthesis
MPRIAAIIPTHNRASFLGDCLTSLCRQNLGPPDYEICVVNNVSTDNTTEVFAAIAARFPQHNLRLVDEPKLGLTHARNKGIASTTAPLIAFGDDDATVGPDWLARFLARFEELGSELGKVGGEIDPVWGAPRPAWLLDSMLAMLSASSEHGKTAKFSDYPIAEGNSCYRRDVLMEVGGFPKHLGRIGTSLLSNDLVIDWIIRAKGYKLFYDPAIILHHYIHPDRLTPKWLRRRYFWQGISDYAGILYLNKFGLTFGDTVKPALPLNISDWAFVNDETATDQLEPSLIKLRWLGFVLTMTGLVQVDAA